MEFNIKHQDNPNKDLYKKEDIDIAFSFSKACVKEFGGFIKSIVLFGSTIRRAEQNNDIDILIIVDDVSVTVSNEMVNAYRIILEKIINKSSRKLHVTTLKMTNFWDYIRKGDPIGLNILREGVALYDMSLFEPLRILLAQGRIMPSAETVNIYFSKSQGSMHATKQKLLQATLDLYWAVIDISHAVLMQHGIMPASPSHVAEKLDHILVSKKLLDKKYVKTMDTFYHLSKEIIHGKKQHISGKEYDEYHKEAEDFVMTLKKLLKR